MAAAAIPLISSILGSLFSGLAGGKQQSVTTQPNTPPWLQQGQQGWLNQYTNALNQAQLPTFNQGNIASWLQQLNQGTAGAQNKFLQGLASAGGYNSGRASTGLSSIANQNLGEQAKFFSELPMEERNQSNQRLSSLLGAGSSFLHPQIGDTKTESGPGFENSFANNLGLMFTAGGFGAGPFAAKNISPLFSQKSGGLNSINPWNLPTNNNNSSLFNSQFGNIFGTLQ